MCLLHVPCMRCGLCRFGQLQLWDLSAAFVSLRACKRAAMSGQVNMHLCCAGLLSSLLSDRCSMSSNCSILSGGLVLWLTTL